MVRGERKWIKLRIHPSSGVSEESRMKYGELQTHFGKGFKWATKEFMAG